MRSGAEQTWHGHTVLLLIGRVLHSVYVSRMIVSNGHDWADGNDSGLTEERAEMFTG